MHCSLELTPDLISERVANTPDHPHLEYKFQEWLSRHGLVARLPDGATSLQKLRELGGELKKQEWLFVPDGMLLMFILEQGKLLSLERQVAIIYGKQLSVISPMIERHRMAVYHSELQSRLDEDKDTTGALSGRYRIGSGLGADPAFVSLFSLQMLHLLWRSSGSYVPVEGLAHSFYGVDGKDKIRAVNSIVSNIRRGIRHVEASGIETGISIPECTPAGYILVEGKN